MARACFADLTIAFAYYLLPYVVTVVSIPSIGFVGFLSFFFSFFFLFFFFCRGDLVHMWMLLVWLTLNGDC